MFIFLVVFVVKFLFMEFLKVILPEIFNSVIHLIDISYPKLMNKVRYSKLIIFIKNRKWFFVLMGEFLIELILDLII